jgi:hypothetical protein
MLGRDNPLSEKETRRRLMRDAIKYGFQKELQMIFNKYDRLMALCPNKKERDDMAKLGALEVVKLFDPQGSVSVDGQVIIRQDGKEILV